VNLIELALDNTRLVLSTLVLLLVSGVVVYVGIPKESDPDINIPIIYVSINHDGISPDDAERLLVRPMEEELRSIEGVKEMRSRAYEGGGNVLLEFDAGFDSDKALDDVRQKVDRAKPKLPSETDEPTVNEVNFSLFPVLVVTLSGPVPERALLRLARDLKSDIESIPTVLEAKIAGERKEQVEIVADPVLVESYSLDPERIAIIVSRFNRLIAAGSIDTGRGRYPVKVPGVFESVRDVMSMPLKVDGESVVTVGDIATVRRTFKDPESFARVNGSASLALEVSKRSGENVIDTIQQIRKVVEARRGAWPETVHVAYSQDRSKDIKSMLGDLQNNVIAAVLLVMVVVIATLGVRSGMIVGVAIPGSFLTGILVLGTMGLTMNIVVLFSLILAVGMLVDGAVIVVEYADRKMTEGMPRREAYIRASRFMAWPVLSSTGTTIAAFLPLLFWPGVVGQFMKYLPITLVATLAASLLMALIFVPVVGALVGRPDGGDKDAAHALATGSREDLLRLRGLIGFYVRLLNGALRRPWLVLVGTVVALGATWGTYIVYGEGVQFFPDVEPDQAAVQIHARGNLSIFEQDALVAEVEAQVLAIARERNEFVSIYTTSGGGGNRSDEAEDVIGTVRLEFAAWNARRPASEILAEIQARTAGIAGIEVEPRKAEAGPPVGKPIQIELSGNNPRMLEATAFRVAERLRGVEGLKDVEDGRPIPGIEWQLAVDHETAARFGADVTVVGWYVQMVTKGLKISSYRPDDSEDELDIVIRYPETNRSVDQLDRIRIHTALGMVPLGNFVKREAFPKIGTLTRTDGRRTMTVKADTRDGVNTDAMVGELKQWMVAAALPPGVDYRFKGEDEEQQQAQKFLGKAFGVALFLIAIILLAEFDSFFGVFLVLTAVIMSTVGVLLGLLITGQPFGIVMSGIGVIALAGVVVNNNIVLIDTFDRLHRDEPNVRIAVLRTGAQRLRPVLLTAVTAILGLLPMVFGLGIDFMTREITVGAPSAQWWTQLSSAIAFGLGFATALTLVVTPAALVAQADAMAWFRRRFQPIVPDEPVSVLDRAAE